MLVRSSILLGVLMVFGESAFAQPIVMPQGSTASMLTPVDYTTQQSSIPQGTFTGSSQYDNLSNQYNDGASSSPSSPVQLATGRKTVDYTTQQSNFGSSTGGTRVTPNFVNYSTQMSSGPVAEAATGSLQQADTASSTGGSSGSYQVSGAPASYTNGMTTPEAASGLTAGAMANGVNTGVAAAQGNSNGDSNTLKSAAGWTAGGAAVAGAAYLYNKRRGYQDQTKQNVQNSQRHFTKAGSGGIASKISTWAQKLIKAK